MQRLGAWWPAFPGYGVLAASILTALWPAVPGPPREPVEAYGACLASMAAQGGKWSAGARGSTEADRATLLSLVGALFVA